MSRYQNLNLNLRKNVKIIINQNTIIKETMRSDKKDHALINDVKYLHFLFNSRINYKRN